MTDAGWSAGGPEDVLWLAPEPRGPLRERAAAAAVHPLALARRLSARRPPFDGALALAGRLAAARARLVDALADLDAARAPSAWPLSRIAAVQVAAVELLSVAGVAGLGGTLPPLLVAIAALPVAAVAAVGVCAFVVRLDAAALRREQGEEQERAELAASFQASNWRQRIGLNGLGASTRGRGEPATRGGSGR